jgi:hypothetical protein
MIVCNTLYLLLSLDSNYHTYTQKMTQTQALCSEGNHTKRYYRTDQVYIYRIIALLHTNTLYLLLSIDSNYHTYTQKTTQNQALCSEGHHTTLYTQ